MVNIVRWMLRLCNYIYKYICLCVEMNICNNKNMGNLYWQKKHIIVEYFYSLFWTHYVSKVLKVSLKFVLFSLWQSITIKLMSIIFWNVYCSFSAVQVKKNFSCLWNALRMWCQDNVFTEDKYSFTKWSKTSTEYCSGKQDLNMKELRCLAIYILN